MKPGPCNLPLKPGKLLRKNYAVDVTVYAIKVVMEEMIDM